MDPQDIVADAVIEALSDRIDAGVLKKALTKPVRKELYKRLAENLLYELLQGKKVALPPGFGSVLIREIREKNKKIFNKKTGRMQNCHIKGNRIVYNTGEIVKQLL